MPTVELKNKYERFDSLFRRFKKSVERADIIKDLRSREFYEKPTTKRKRAKAAAKKRWKKQLEAMRPIPRANRH